MPHGQQNRAQQVGTGFAVEALQGDVVAAWCQACHGTDQGPGTKGGHHHTQRPGQGQHAAGHHQQQQRQRRRRHQRTAQVVQHLPTVDIGQRQAPAASQERQQLPVAACPAVQPRRGDVGVIRGVLDERDFTERGAAGQRAFEQVVAQHLAFGQAQRQRGVHGLNVQQALAGEAALAEQVLVDLGAGCTVGVQAALAVEQRVVAGGRVLRRQWRFNARLQDAVAADDAAHARIPARLIHRVRRHAHQRAQTARWHLGVGVECHEVTCARRGPRQRAQIDKGPVAGLHQRPHQLFELATLAFPTDPALFAFAEAALTVQQQKTRRIGRCFVLCVQRLHALLRRTQQGGVVRLHLGLGISVVTEQRKLRMALGVGQRVLLKLGQQRQQRGRCAQHHGHHHQGAVVGADATRERQSRQAHRRHRFTHQPVDHRHHGFADGPCRQHAGHHQQPQRRSAVGTLQDRPQAQGREQRHAHQVKRRHPVPEDRRAPPGQTTRAQLKPAAQFVFTLTTPPVRGCAARVVGCTRNSRRVCGGRVCGRRGCGGRGCGGRQRQQFVGHIGLGQVTGPRQLFDGMQRGVLRCGVFFGMNRAARQDRHHRTALGHQGLPVRSFQLPQGGDGIADALLVFGGFVLQTGQHGTRVRDAGVQPVAQRVLR